MRHVMIMAGGSGTRLWPMSRPGRPKQLIPFLPPGNTSLLETAISRARAVLEVDDEDDNGKPAEDVNLWICTSREFASLIVDQLDFPAERILTEPVGRDTLNAIGFTAHALRHTDPDAIICVLTADHMIEPVSAFAETIRAGFETIEDNHRDALITFSIVPDRPAIEYGYIERDTSASADDDRSTRAHAVKRYVEKPDLESAERFLKAGNFGWSSGMFVFGASAVIRAIKKFQPTNHAGLEKIANAWGTSDQEAVLNNVYPKLSKISVDYAIMEPASRDDAFEVLTISMRDVTWLDVGSWSSLATLHAPDEHGNRISSEVTAALLDSRNCIVIGEHDPASQSASKTVALIGCENLVVVHTPDAILICPRDREQDVKKLVERMG